MNNEHTLGHRVMPAGGLQDHFCSKRTKDQFFSEHRQAEVVTRALGGRWYGRYGIACCPVHDDRRPSLSLADGEDGRLLIKCHAGCPFQAVIDTLTRVGVLPNRGNDSRPQSVQLMRPASLTSSRGEQDARALSVWRESVALHGTLGETYLRSRRISCDLPNTLRFNPACRHPSGNRLPALVGIVEGGDGFAIHRTYLRSDGVGKTCTEPTKAMLGRVRGGAVRLTCGGDRLVVAEGIETALSLACGLLRGPASIWAALSTGGLRALKLPDTPSRLTIAADGDVAGRKAAHDLAMRANHLGWQVSLLPAPEGRDWNDVVNGRAQR